MAGRKRDIMAAAELLFGRSGYESTTMAEIANRAGVSRPTVFNYFRTKEELLLALVLDVHHQTQDKVQALRPSASDPPAAALCRFLSVYSETSLGHIDKRTWRHVESTQIRMPESDFVRSYDRFTLEMLNDFRHFIDRMVEIHSKAAILQTEPIARMIFNHWSALFVELVRDDRQSVEDHIERLRGDLEFLVAALIGS